MLTGAGNQTKRGSTCSEAQILRKQIPQHLPWGQSTGALNAGALLLRRRRWAAAPVSGTRVKKQEGNSRQRNREGPKDTWSGHPGTAGGEGRGTHEYACWRPCSSELQFP